MTGTPNTPKIFGDFEDDSQPNSNLDGKNLGLGIIILETALNLSDDQALEKMGDVIGQISTLKG